MEAIIAKPARAQQPAKPKTPVQAKPQPAKKVDPQTQKELPEEMKKRLQDVERRMGYRKYDMKEKAKTPEIMKPQEKK